VPSLSTTSTCLGVISGWLCNHANFALCISGVGDGISLDKPMDSPGSGSTPVKPFHRGYACIWDVPLEPIAELSRANPM
jgi:hypothetical protein